MYVLNINDIRYRYINYFYMQVLQGSCIGNKQFWKFSKIQLNHSKTSRVLRCLLWMNRPLIDRTRTVQFSGHYILSWRSDVTLRGLWNMPDPGSAAAIFFPIFNFDLGWQLAREPRGVTSDFQHNVSDEIPWMVRLEPVYIDRGPVYHYPRFYPGVRHLLNVNNNLTTIYTIRCGYDPRKCTTWSWDSSLVKAHAATRDDDRWTTHEKRPCTQVVWGRLLIACWCLCSGLLLVRMLLPFKVSYFLNNDVICCL